MPLLDRVFVYAYALVLSSPSKGRAEKAASFIVALVLIMNALGCLILLSAAAHRNLMSSFGKTGIVLGVLIVIGAVTSYFSSAGRTRVTLQEAAGDIRSKRTKWVGLAIVLWSFSFPFFSGALIVILHKWQVF